jgi:hypothetical protein
MAVSGTGTREIGYPVDPRAAVDVLEKIRIFAPAGGANPGPSSP